MSRSKRKDIIKDGGFSSEYWRHVRRVQNNSLRSNLQLIDLEEIEIPQPKTIVNDYDYCDYIFRDMGIEYTRK